MAAITQQKADMRDILRRIVMDAYDSADTEEARRHLMQGLLSRHLQQQTLGKLKSWHRGIVYAEMICEKHRTAAGVPQ